MTTDSFTFHFDFRCPFCFVARERIGAAGLGASIAYRSVRHDVGLPIPARAPTADERAFIGRELDVLRIRVPELDFAMPEVWPSTFAAARLLAAIERTQPARADAYVAAVSRAMWREGRDISISLALGAAVRAAGCGGVAPTVEDDVTLERWSRDWADRERRTPTIVSPHGVALVGLPTERRLLAFLLSGKLGDENEEFCSTPLAAPSPQVHPLRRVRRLGPRRRPRPVGHLLHVPRQGPAVDRADRRQGARADAGDRQRLRRAVARPRILSFRAPGAWCAAPSPIGRNEAPR